MSQLGKQSILNSLSALKTLNNGMPNIEFNPNFPSLNDDANVFDFLIDLFKTIVGVEAIKETIVKFLSYETEALELIIKNTLFKILKSFFSCNNDGLIEQKYFTDGIVIPLKCIDFFEILKINPSSPEGTLVYNNASDDLNKYMYNSIQGQSGDWKNLINITYSNYGSFEGRNTPDVIVIKIANDWNGKTINDFLNSLVTNINIFDTQSLMNRIFDVLSGVITSFSDKSEKAIENQLKVEEMVVKIVKGVDGEDDNSFYQFTNEELNGLNDRLLEYKYGKRILKDCGFIESGIDFNTLLEKNIQLNSADKVEIPNVISNTFTEIEKNANLNVSNENKQKAKENFFESILRGFLKSLLNEVLSPKVLLMICIYIKMVKGKLGFISFDGFFEKYGGIVLELLKNTILPKILDYILKFLLKEIRDLIILDTVGRKIELIKNNYLQTLSLLGIPSYIRDLIRKI